MAYTQVDPHALVPVTEETETSQAGTNDGSAAVEEQPNLPAVPPQIIVLT